MTDAQDLALLKRIRQQHRQIEHHYMLGRTGRYEHVAIANQKEKVLKQLTIQLFNS